MPNKSTSFFGAIAKGSFIVHHSYITKSKNSGRFLDESSFEFARAIGNPKFENIGKEMLCAGLKWRCLINGSNMQRYRHGAFTGISFAMINDGEKSELFSELLISGGARKVFINFYDKSLARENVSHCFYSCEENLYEYFDQNGINELLRENIKIMKTSSIIEYLLSSCEKPEI